MSFIIGLLSGLLIGAAGAVMYSVQTGRDLRQEFEQIRTDIDQRDFDALGKHLEERFKELQSSLEDRFAQARELTPTTAGDTSSPAYGGAMPPVSDAGTWPSEDAAPTMGDSGTVTREETL